MSRIEIYRAEDGQYRGRLYDDAGEIVPIRPGGVGGVYPARERAANRAAVQAALKSMFERQQAGQSGA